MKWLRNSYTWVWVQDTWQDGSCGKLAVSVMGAVCVGVVVFLGYGLFCAANEIGLQQHMTHTTLEHSWQQQTSTPIPMVSLLSEDGMIVTYHDYIKKEWRIAITVEGRIINATLSPECHKRLQEGQGLTVYYSVRRLTRTARIDTVVVEQ